MRYRAHMERERQRTMKQQTLAMAADQGAGFETRRKRTRRDEFLDTMNTILPWAWVWAVRQTLSPEPRQWPPADWPGAYAADSLRAALVQPGRLCLRRGAVRQHQSASLC